MRSGQGEKRIWFVDGENLPGLISVDAINKEQDAIDVPGYRKTSQVTNGVDKTPEITLTYRLDKNTETGTFYRNWIKNTEEHDCMMQRTNHKGEVFETILYPGCLCRAFNIPAYEAASPTVAQFTAILLPDDEVVVE